MNAPAFLVENSHISFGVEFQPQYETQALSPNLFLCMGAGDTEPLYILYYSTSSFILSGEQNQNITQR